MSEPASTFMLSPTGEVVAFSPEEAAKLPSPWAPATPKQISDFQLQTKFGTPTEMGKTFLEHFGSINTLGASTYGEIAAGAKPEDIAARSEANPISGIAGDVVGLGASLLTGEGEAAIAGRLGEAAGSVAERALGREAESVVGRIAQKAVAGATKAATEGVVFGVGQQVSESALDPQWTPEAALANVGLSAALGGGLGFIGGAGSQSISEATAAAREALGALSGTFPSSKSFADSFQEMHGAMEEAVHRANKYLKPEEFEQIINAAVTPEEGQQAYADIINKASRAAEEMRADPELYPARWAKRVEDLSERMARNADAVRDNPAEAFSHIEDFKRRLDDLIQFDKIPRDENAEAISALKSLRHDVKTALENEDVWGPGGARQASYNEALSEYLSAKKDVERAFTVPKRAPGGVQRQFDPVKLESIASTNEGRAASRGQMLERYRAASRRLLDEMEPMAEQVIDTEEMPVRRLSVDALRHVELPSVNLEEARSTSRLREIAKAKPEDLPPIRIGPDVHGQMSIYDGQHRMFHARQTGRKEILAQLSGGTPSEWEKVLAPGEKPVGHSILRQRENIQGLIDKTGDMAQGIRRAANFRQAAQVMSGLGTVAAIGLPQPIGAMAGAALKIASVGAKHIPRAAEVLSRLAENNSAMSRRVASAVSAIAHGSETVSPGLRAIANHALSESHFNARLDEIKQLATPAAMSAAMDNVTRGMEQHAPITTLSAKAQTARAISFLSTKLPPTTQPHPLSPAAVTPSSQDMAKFERYRLGAMEPMAALHLARTGRLAPETLEALRVCWPQTMARAQEAALAELARPRASAMPEKSRATLSLLLGGDVDGAHGATAIRAFQSAYAMNKPQPAPSSQKKPSQTGLAKLKSAEQMMTPGQAQQQRMNDVR